MWLAPQAGRGNPTCLPRERSIGCPKQLPAGATLSIRGVATASRGSGRLAIIGNHSPTPFAETASYGLTEPERVAERWIIIGGVTSRSMNTLLRCPFP